uniref:Uncharacterized protein n=1 Tax=Strigamia maritima TaxID=126957 RepID=T1JBT1_STRMM
MDLDATCLAHTLSDSCQPDSGADAIEQTLPYSASGHCYMEQSSKPRCHVVLHSPLPFKRRGVVLLFLHLEEFFSGWM